MVVKELSASWEDELNLALRRKAQRLDSADTPHDPGLIGHGLQELFEYVISLDEGFSVAIQHFDDGFCPIKSLESECKDDR